MKRYCLILSGTLIILILSLSPITYGVISGLDEAVTSPTDIFMKGYIKVIGTSQDNHMQYRAVRAAKIAAYKKTLAALAALPLTGDLTVGQAMSKSSDFKNSVSAYLKGSTSCGENFNKNLRHCTVCMKLTIRGSEGDFYSVFYPTIEKENILTAPGPIYNPKIEQLKKKTSNESTTSLTEPDSLIIDLRGMSFQPAFINRIVTPKNEVVYDISHIKSTILAERGMGGYEKDEENARAMLKQWGGAHPMIIKPQEVLQGTDIKVSQNQAEDIFIHNQHKNFLENGLILFLF